MNTEEGKKESSGGKARKGWRERKDWQREGLLTKNQLRLQI
jgi:hypothetical protein